MGVEIERKFLVLGQDWRGMGKKELLRQGYLSSNPERTVRVRVEGETAQITIKGKSLGATRQEWEYPIPLADANIMLNTLCEQPMIEKFRYRIPFKGMIWEVDEFLGENSGLVVAEIELSDENQAFIKPSWIGKEVTSDPRYFNSSLLRHPFSLWS
jgi:adenylate cyclase